MINPQIRSVCDPAFPGSTPSDARCVAGASTRYFDAAFVRAGLGAGRLAQINMIGTTNESKFDSWTTTVRGRTPRAMVSFSYVLANSRAWGGQPTASYSGNGIAITPGRAVPRQRVGTDAARRAAPHRRQRRDRRCRSGSSSRRSCSSRPRGRTRRSSDFDINGDGQTNIVDRLCAGVELGKRVRRARRRRRHPRAEPERVRARRA